MRFSSTAKVLAKCMLKCYRGQQQVDRTCCRMQGSHNLTQVTVVQVAGQALLPAAAMLEAAAVAGRRSCRPAAVPLLNRTSIPAPAHPADPQPPLPGNPLPLPCQPSIIIQSALEQPGPSHRSTCGHQQAADPLLHQPTSTTRPHQTHAPHKEWCTSSFKTARQPMGTGNLQASLRSGSCSRSCHRSSAFSSPILPSWTAHFIWGRLRVPAGRAPK